jgi:hypothetical protein
VLSVAVARLCPLTCPRLLTPKARRNEPIHPAAPGGSS